MRTIRALTVAAAVVAALPTVALAQNARTFNDSWFWGVKAGGLTFTDSAQAYKQAPLAGVEWMITRTHGGLYVSLGQAFFTSSTFTLRDPNAPADSGLRVIDLKNMRRLDVALMGFPGEHLKFHPYVGIGFSMSDIVDATPVGPFGNDDQINYAQQVIQEQKVAFSPMLIAGLQYRLKWVSVFGQATASPAQSNFLLYNGKPYSLTYEFGLRYNAGTSISRQ